MAIKAILTDLSDAPEALHSEYQAKEINGKTVYVLSVEGVDDHPAVANLKSAYERVKADKAKLVTDLKEASGKLAGLPDDFDPEEWARLRTEDEGRKNDPSGKDVRAQIDAATSAVKSQFEARIARLQKDADAKLAEKDRVVSELDSELRARLVGDGLKAALAGVGVKKGLLDAAVASFERNVEVVVEDGRRVARMKDDMGGDEIEKYIANWAQGDGAKDFIDPARGDDERGSGSKHTAEQNPFGKKAWSKTAQATVLTQDRGKAERLAKSAGFKSLDAALRASVAID